MTKRRTIIRREGVDANALVALLCYRVGVKDSQRFHLRPAGRPTPVAAGHG